MGKIYKIMEVRESSGGNLFEFRLSVGYVLDQVQSSKFGIVTEPVTCTVFR